MIKNDKIHLRSSKSCVVRKATTKSIRATQGDKILTISIQGRKQKCYVYTWERSTRDLGYLPFTKQNRKFRSENEMFRAIPFGKLRKIWTMKTRKWPIIQIAEKRYSESQWEA